MIRRGHQVDGSAPTPAADAKVVKPAAADAPAVDASPAGDLPALADVDNKAIEASFELNNAGYLLHKQKKFDDAAAKYREAVESDPADLLARYNLASAWFDDAGVARCDARCCYAGQRGDTTNVVEHGGVLFVTEIGVEYGPA